MESPYTRIWLLQLYITHETKTDWEKHLLKTLENVYKKFQLRHKFNTLILFVGNI